MMPGRLTCAVVTLCAVAAAGAPAAPTTIDDLVFARLKALRMEPAPVSPDAVFLRRAYLDVIGTLPTADEARAFLADHAADKRARLVDALLAREEFADYWAMKWSEALRVKSEFPINLWPNAVQAYHRWIRASVRVNVPVDRFARELLTSSGSNFRVPPVNFYRAVQSREPHAIAAAVALTFMGTRFEKWPKARQVDMAAFFSQIGYKPTREWKEEIVFFDRFRAPGRPGPRTPFTFPDGTTTRLAPDDDPREAFAAWLTAPKNPWFARAVANRAWFWLVGRGVVHEPDDMRPDNPPVNPALLALLERELVAARYDVKHLYRLILTSRTYQLSSIPRSDRPDAAAHFAHASVRPLEAEVLIDAICRVTATGEAYSSSIPEPFTFMPAGQRAVRLADGSVTSGFLETFGRPSRDTGLLSERSLRPTAAARLHLLNSTHIQRKLEESPALRALMQQGGNGREMVSTLYLTILSRHPSEEELKAIDAYARSTAAPRRAAFLDLAWALINSVEFQYRH